jgi:BlaI family transcriptional regulator, penicillinase repressor
MRRYSIDLIPPMKRKSVDNLGELQKAIMETVWSLGEATTRQVWERLNPTRALAYTTVLSIMQRLERIGWLNHRIEGRAYVYQATLTRDQESRRSLKEFIQRVFQGNSRLVFQHLIEDEALGEADLQALHALIDQKRRERK